MSSWKINFISAAIICLILNFASGSADPVVVTDCGGVIGLLDAHGGASYRGIPYAAPPIQSRRWTVVDTLKAEDRCWKGNYTAQKPGPMCAQFDLQSSEHGPAFLGDEDCLNLDVFVPPHSGTGPLPVLVFSYGGSSTSGDAGMYDFTDLARVTGAIVVANNYRLNVFGFMATKELSDAASTGTSGNYGLADSITALRWVQNNIASFSGDPKSVAFFGQSSGGTQVLALSVSRHADGLFRAGISMSGSPLIEGQLNDAERENEGFVANTGCAKAKDVVSCMRALSTRAVFEAMPWDTYPFWSQPTQSQPPLPGDFQIDMVFADGDIVPKEGLRAALAAGRRVNATLVVGNMLDELELGPPVPYNTSAQVSAFLKTNFDALFGAGEQVVEGYESFLKADPTGWWAYQRADTDVRMVCPSRLIMKEASSAPGTLAKTFPVYGYLAISGPDNNMPNPYDPTGPMLTRAFHVWDLLTLINRTNTWDPEYRSGPGDIALGAALARDFVSFAATGRPATSQWAPFPVYRTFSGLSADPVVQHDPKSSICEVWEPAAWAWGMKN